MIKCITDIGNTKNEIIESQNQKEIQELVEKNVSLGKGAAYSREQYYDSQKIVKYFINV
jgi:hypothetical protein